MPTQYIADSNGWYWSTVSVIEESGLGVRIETAWRSMNAMADLAYMAEIVKALMGAGALYNEIVWLRQVYVNRG